MNGENNISNSRNECIPSDLLLKYTKGELTGIERNRIERHVSSCEMCRDELEGISNINNPDDIEDISNELNARIDEVVKSNKRSTPKIAYFFRVAASIVLLIGITATIYIISNRNRPALLMTENEEVKAKKEVLRKDSLISGGGKAITGIRGIEKKELVKSDEVKENNEAEIEVEPAGNGEAVIEPVQVFDSITDIVIDEVSIAETAPVESDSVNQISEALISERILNEEVAQAQAVGTERKGFSLRRRKASSKLAAAPAKEPILLDEKTEEKKAIYYFNNGLYDKALGAFNNLLDKDPSNDTILYYTAICNYHQNSFYDAVRKLKPLSSKPNFAFYHEAKWYYALALIQVGGKSAADSTLRTIIQDNSPYTEMAKQKLSNP